MPESHRYMYDADADTDTGRGSCADKNSQVHHIRRVLTTVVTTGWFGTNGAA